LKFPSDIISQIEQNNHVLQASLSGLPKELELFKINSESWCLLEIICHLLDEEVYDFRTRIKHILETPELSFKPISPTTWPIDHQYLHQNFQEILLKFLEERNQSVIWLKGLKTVSWELSTIHPEIGVMSARTFLENWLAHDFLHIRQINALKRAYFDANSGDNLTYAGNW